MLMGLTESNSPLVPRIAEVKTRANGRLQVEGLFEPNMHLLVS